MKDFIIILLILLNALYWGYVLVTWNKYTEEGIWGRCFCGMFLIGMSCLLIGLV